MAPMPDYAAPLLAELRAHGVTDAAIHRPRRGHPQIRFTWQGRRMFFVFAGTPSDARGQDNALSDLRRLLGVKRIIHKSTAPAKKRNRTEAPIVLTFATRPDPLLALAPMKARVQEADRTAFLAGQHAFLAGHGDAAPAGWSARLSEQFRAGWWRMHGGTAATWPPPGTARLRHA